MSMSFIEGVALLGGFFNDFRTSNFVYRRFGIGFIFFR